MSDTAGARPVTVRLDDLCKLRSAAAGAGWNRIDDPGINGAWHRITEVAEAEGPEYARVHLDGGAAWDGWVSDGVIAGTPCLDIRDEAGRLIAKIPPHAVCLYQPLILRPELPAEADRGEAGPLPAGAHEGYYGGEDGHGEPADAFPVHRGPDETVIL